MPKSLKERRNFNWFYVQDWMELHDGCEFQNLSYTKL